MDINIIMARHIAWLVEQNYRPSTPLEKLALITSEIGEAVNECRNDEVTDQFPLELADIILRVFGTAYTMNIDIERALLDKIKLNETRGARGRKV